MNIWGKQLLFKVWFLYVGGFGNGMFLCFCLFACDAVGKRTSRNRWRRITYPSFQPYKDLCALMSSVILEYNPDYKFPKSLASTIVEIAHFQNFFMHNLSSLTDFSKRNKEAEIVEFLENFVFSGLR